MNARKDLPDDPVLSYDARLKEISAIPAGWDGHGNPAPTAAAIDSMRNFLADVALQPVPEIRSHLYPSIDGGGQAEWSIGAWEISAEIGPQGLRVELFAVNVVTMSDFGKDLDLKQTNLVTEFAVFMAVLK